MKLIQIVLILFFLDTSLANESLWKNILHFNGDGTNDVVSSEWYLSNQRTSTSELEAAINFLNGTDGSFYACEFPARYSFLKKKGLIRSMFNLDECHDLMIFSKRYKKKYFSLAMTSEYFNAPSSAFGHIMLLLHDNVYPEPDSIVIHFSALTHNDDFFRYAINGLTGLYSGYFFSEPFFKKYNEYSNIEQRYIFVHPLKLSDDGKMMMIYHLYELQKARFRYYFMSKNCGHQLQKLLYVALEKELSDSRIYSLPSEVLKGFKSDLGSATTLSPLSARTEEAIQDLSQEEKDQFRKIIQNQENADNQLSNKLKKALVLYSQFQFRKKRNILPQYQNIQQLTVNDLHTEKESSVKSPLLKTSPARLSFKISHFQHEKYPAYVLSFRPLLIDRKDFQNHSMNESVFSLLDSEIILRKKELYIEKFDFFNLKLISESRPFFREPSWFLRSGFNRENREKTSQFSNSFGIGYALKKIILTSAFLGTGVDYSLNRKRIQPVVTSELDAFYYIGDSFKISYEGSWKLMRKTNWFTNDLSLAYRVNEFVTRAGYVYSIERNFYLSFNFYF